MKNKKIAEAFDTLTPTTAQKQNIFDHMMTKKRSSIQMKKQITYTVLGLASCALFAVGMTMVPTQPEISPQAPQETSPMGMRRFMTFENHRYAFLDSQAGVTFEEQPSNLLGELSVDLIASPELSATENLGTTFGLGGTVYQIPNVDPLFRVAVLVDGEYHVAQNVSGMDETALDLPTYFEAAKFNEVATSSEVYNHMQTSVVKSLSGDETHALLDIVVTGTPTVLTSEQFEALAQKQFDDESYLVKVALSDDTVFEFYIVPTLDLVSVGDHYYHVDFN